MIAGRMAPPAAAMIGKSACRRFDSSPTVISYLISNPTRRKKIAISTSETKCASVDVKETPPMTIPISECRTASKGSYAGLFARTSEMTAAMSMMTAALVEECVNSIAF